MREEVGPVLHDLLKKTGLSFERVGFTVSSSAIPYVAINPETAAITVSKGAINALQGNDLKNLTREMKAVLAHEVAGHVGQFNHLKWGKFSMFFAGPAIAITAYDIGRRALDHSHSREDVANIIGNFKRSDDLHLSERAFQVAKYLAIAALGVAGGGFTARQMARRGEFLADRRGVNLIGDPEAMISALRRLESASERYISELGGNDVSFLKKLWNDIKNMTYHAHPTLEERTDYIRSAKIRRQGSDLPGAALN